MIALLSILLGGGGGDSLPPTGGELQTKKTQSTKQEMVVEASFDGDCESWHQEAAADDNSDNFTAPPQLWPPSVIPPPPSPLTDQYWQITETR